MTNPGNTHQDGHSGGVMTKAETDTGDSKVVTNLGDTHKDGHRAGVMTKAENDIGDFEAGTNCGDSHQDGHRTGVITKAETDIGDTKAVTNLGDTHQDGHRAGVMIKAETNSSDSEVVTNHHAVPIEGHDEEEKEQLIVDNSEDNQLRWVFIADLPPALPPEVRREAAAQDEVYQRLRVAMKKGRKATDRDREPHMAVWGELGALEERLRKGERTVIPEGRHTDYDMDLREREVEELLSRGERSASTGGAAQEGRRTRGGRHLPASQSRAGGGPQHRPQHSSAKQRCRSFRNPTSRRH